MPEWLEIILIGGVTLSLIGVIYKQMLTKADHAEICQKAQRNLIDAMEKKMEEVKTHFDLQIENVVLKEIRKINGGAHG